MTYFNQLHAGYEKIGDIRNLSRNGVGRQDKVHYTSGYRTLHSPVSRDTQPVSSFPSTLP